MYQLANEQDRALRPGDAAVKIIHQIYHTVCGLIDSTIPMLKGVPQARIYHYVSQRSFTHTSLKRGCA